MAKQLAEYKPAYLIVGEQDLLLDQALDQLKRALGEVADLDFNMELFDGESADADAIVSACNTLPFASERRLVIVRSIEKMDKAATDRLVEYCTDPAPTTILALVAKKIAKNTRLYKVVDKLGGVIARNAPKPSEYPRRVQEMFVRKGKEITRAGAELLVNSVGRDLRRLDAEVDKAVAFAGERAGLGEDDIRELAATTTRAKAYELGIALADRDCARVLGLANRLLGDGESVFALHALAVRQVRDLIITRSLLDRGTGSTSQVAKAVGRPDWQVRNLTHQAGGYSSDELADALRGAAHAEADMKTSRDARLAFERWIMDTCG